MVGIPTCASTLPSMNSTNECTTLWGCTTTSMRSYGTPKRKCASMTSSALFASVALSTVILRPMLHVGCRSASATVARSSCSRVQPRNGPPDAVMMSRRTSLGRPVPETLQDGRMLAVDRDDLAAAGLRRRRDEIARHDQRFLVGECHALPRSQRRQRRIQSRRPDDGVDHDVHTRQRRGAHEALRADLPAHADAARHPAPGRRTAGLNRSAWPSSSAALPYAVSASTRKRSTLALQHPQRRRADRSRRPEHGNSAHGDRAHACPCAASSATATHG